MVAAEFHIKTCGPLQLLLSGSSIETQIIKIQIQYVLYILFERHFLVVISFLWQLESKIATERLNVGMEINPIGIDGTIETQFQNFQCCACIFFYIL